MLRVDKSVSLPFDVRARRGQFIVFNLLDFICANDVQFKLLLDREEFSLDRECVRSLTIDLHVPLAEVVLRNLWR